ncbi:hypothetical protein CBL_08529 [Carabus blaptoides fortunei]
MQEDADVDSDPDSDLSDNEAEEDLDHLPAKILATGVQTSIEEDDPIFLNIEASTSTGNVPREVQTDSRSTPHSNKSTQVKMYASTNKQFMRGKPIRFGFKLRVMADPSGYVFHAELYCGSSTRLPTTGCDQGTDVVLGLVDHVELRVGTIVYSDNLFTSVHLLEELSKRRLGGTGTLRENRVSD